MKGWEKGTSLFGAQTLRKQGVGFYVNYNSNTDCGPETAIVQDDRYLILLGDHVKAYDALIDKGFDACREYYEANISQKSQWSSDTLDFLTEEEE